MKLWLQIRRFLLYGFVAMQSQIPLLQGRPSATAILLERGFDAFVVLVAILAIAVPFYALSSAMGALFALLALFGFGLIAIRASFDFVEREYSVYRLEPDRLVVERGAVSRRRVVVPLDAVHLQRVFARQSFLGRLGGYGDVVIATAGSGGVRLRYVNNPYHWQDEILRHVGPIAPDMPLASTSPLVPGRAFPPAKLALILTGFISLICVGSLFLGGVSIHLSHPAPTPTPQPSIFSGLNITTGDILSAMWMLYQIPTIFWLVNLVIIASLATTIMEAAARRR
jgi:membrane protein YdbS with pleckstrin-like domain